jgi:hypothetical protein
VSVADPVDARRTDAPLRASPRPDRRLLLAVPALLTLHNLEELLAMPRALPAIAARMPDVARAVLPAVTPPMFAAALAVATAVPWAFAAMALAGRRAGVYGVLLIQATLLVNVASHLASAAFLRGYAPGLATALFVNLPFSVHLLGRARREGWTERRGWAMLFPLALVVHGPGFVGLLWLSGRLTGAF